MFKRLLDNIHTIQERNKMILHAIEKGYSQYMIAKVLEVSQQAVHGAIKRSKK